MCARGAATRMFLSDMEPSDLQAELPNLWQQYIERLSKYMASTDTADGCRGAAALAGPALVWLAASAGQVSAVLQKRSIPRR